MLVSYMHVPTDNDRQATDLQRDALLAAARPARRRPSQSDQRKFVHQGHQSTRDTPRRYGLLQREECRHLPCGRHRAVDLGGARSTPSTLARALRGAGPAEQSGQPREKDETQPQDPGRPCRLWATQADSRAGVRHHQIRDGLSPVHAARAGQGWQRMDAGLPHLEFEAHGRIAPAIRPMGMKCGKIRLFWDYSPPKIENMPDNSATPAVQATIDWLPTLSPTGC